MNLKPWMKWFIPIFFVITCAFFVATFFCDNGAIVTVAVTLITTFYQAVVRPFSGTVIDCTYHNKMDHNKWWFRERKFEKRLYKILRVHKWKSIIPTYDKDQFDFSKRSAVEILGATCQAEVVHETMFVLSFLPLLLIIPYGRPLVFIITSSVCALFECVFIVVQRYNRPRLKRLYERQEKSKRNQTAKDVEKAPQ